MLLNIGLAVCFLLFMVVYWFSEGCTEGYTWANKARRSKNVLIFGSVNKKGKPSGQGILDYHAWRLGENLGNVGCMLVAYMLGMWCETNFYDLVLIWLGSWMVGYFVYERALNYVCSGSAFTTKGPWKMMHISIERSSKFDIAVCIAGLIVFYLGAFSIIF